MSTIMSSVGGLVIVLAVLASVNLFLVSAQLFGSPFGSSSTSTSTTTTTTTTTNIIRLRQNRPRHRPSESCRESLPRKSEDLPALVITGRVKEVYLSEQAPNANSTTPSAQSPDANRALVNIVRVIKGNKQLAGGDIVVSGFNSSSAMPCPNYVIPNDTLIFLLEPKGDKKYSIQGSNLLSMNLHNLDRINAIANDELYKRRPPIEDILCEAHYCPYGRCVVDERTNQTSCKCPDHCPPLPSLVCGSDNTTYANECHLIKEGCRRQKPLFVTKEAAC